MHEGNDTNGCNHHHVTQYTLDEMRAAVDAAEDWGTYVTVHAYTPHAVKRAIEAGVKCVETESKFLIIMKNGEIYKNILN